jgi:hypothetical protein
MRSTDLELIFALLVLSGVLVLSGCNVVYPADCKTRWENHVLELPLPFESARSTLVFDFTAATKIQSEQIVANGFAGSGTPGLTIVTGGDGSPNFSPSVVPPKVLLGTKKLIIIKGPEGGVSKIISEACTLEMDRVSLKKINFQPFSTTEVSPSRTDD